MANFDYGTATPAAGSLVIASDRLVGKVNGSPAALTFSGLESYLGSNLTTRGTRTNPVSSANTLALFLAGGITGVADGAALTSAYTDPLGKIWTPSGSPIWRSGTSSNACPNGYPCLEFHDTQKLVSDALSSAITFASDNWTMTFLVAVPYGSMNDQQDGYASYQIGGFWQASPTTAWAGLYAEYHNYTASTFKTGTNTNCSWGSRLGGTVFRVVTLDARAGTANIRVNGSASNYVGTTNTFSVTNPSFAAAVGFALGASFIENASSIKIAVAILSKGATLGEVASNELWLSDLGGTTFDRPISANSGGQVNITKPTVIAPYTSSPGLVGNTHTVPSIPATLSVFGAFYCLSEPRAGSTGGTPHHLMARDSQNNVVNICNLASDGFSAVVTMDYALTERQATGFGNPDSGNARWADSNFVEISNIPTSGAFGTPSPYRIASTHVSNACYQHQLITPSDGSFKIFNKVAFSSDWTTNQVAAVNSDGLGNVMIGNPTLATNAVDGFAFIPRCNGAPTGVPTGITGGVPLIYDYANNKFYVYNGAWKMILLA